MAKKRPRPSEQAALFPDAFGGARRRGAPRPHKSLFLPQLLAEASREPLDSDSREKASAIIVRWADLASAGHLEGRKETSTDADFLYAVFRDALGYRTKPQSPEAYQLERSFTVPGVGTADGAIGDFPSSSSPVAVIELKDSGTDLDRDRASGRTAVQQCWDYLNHLPKCPWGIVSNFVTIRLYHRERTPQAYEEFSLTEMRDRAQRFNEFYCLFEPGGLLRPSLNRPLRALRLLKHTSERQRAVGDHLYEFYAAQRAALIDFLVRERGKLLDSAIRLAQKLLDRIIFIAFCEDRGLLNENVLDKAWTEKPAFTKAINPRWQNFRALFEHVDKGHPSVGLREGAGYNGGLFRDADDAELDALDLPDEPWTTAFRAFGNYDFSEEVNVDVLGHIFERSITELEKLRKGGLLALKAALESRNGNGNGAARKRSAAKTSRRTAMAPSSDDTPSDSAMPKSPLRKRFGIYYTPPEFTGLIVERTVDALVDERFAECARRHGVDLKDHRGAEPARAAACWRDCLEVLKSLRICDPACGSGAFLIRAYESLAARYQDVANALGGLDEALAESIEDSAPDLILQNNLFGVDLQPEAVEITQLALWIRSARRGRTLAELSRNIVCGNSLVADPAVDPHAIDWPAKFPEVFAAAGFDAVVGNPPWERLKVQEREFFALTDPDIAQAVSAADRRRRIAALPREKPELYAHYLTAKKNAERVLTYARESNAYPLTGRGDINTYMLFAELARKIVGPRGLVGMLTPSGIATDDTTKAFFNAIMDDKALVCLYDFENKVPVFPDVHRSFKFSVLVFGGAERKADSADFVFFAHGVDDVDAARKQRHIPLSAADMALFNPNTRTCPVFRTRRDADLTRSIYRRVPILIDRNRKTGGNPWGIRFIRMFDQTNDAEKFVDADTLRKQGYKLEGSRWRKGRKVYLPLYEAKMIQAYDHRAASVVVEETNWFRQGQKAETSPAEHQNPEFLVMPRWWVQESEVSATLGGYSWPALLAFKNVTSPTNTRTMIAAFVPICAVGNSAPILLFPNNVPTRLQACLLANLNAFVLDYVARQKIGNVNLNFFLIEQFPILHPDCYDDACPWDKHCSLETWISKRVLSLSCTANDLRELAVAAAFRGDKGNGIHRWRAAERARLQAELDAAFFRLYGSTRADVEYILGTFRGTGGDDNGFFGRDASGAMVLDAFDELAP